jgi:exosortase
MSGTRATVTAGSIAGASALLLFGPAFWRLIQDWIHDENYSHGFVILPFALYFIWERRRRLRELRPAPSLSGLGIVLAGLALFVVGQLGAELFLTRIAMLVAIGGVVVFLRGWATLRACAFPLAFLLLMIPIPSIIFNQVAFPLQLLASRTGEAGLSVLGIPVLREGNLIIMARTTLEVAEACSGIRSLVALLTLGILYGYFTDSRTTIRWILAASTIPIAIVANGIRVAGTGVAAHYLGDSAAQGFLHTFSGWLMFVAAFVMLFAIGYLIQRLAPPAGPTAAEAPAVLAPGISR